jgi:hypothetical protein
MAIGEQSRTVRDSGSNIREGQEGHLDQLSLSGAAQAPQNGSVVGHLLFVYVIQINLASNRNPFYIVVNFPFSPIPKHHVKLM